MATPKTASKSTTPAAAAAPAPAKAEGAAKAPNGFDRGKDYEPALALQQVDLSDITFRKRGVQQDSKYKELLEKASTLAVGKGFIVSETEAEGVEGQVLFQRLSPYFRRHSMTANKNGALTVRLDANNQVIIGCVDRGSVQAPRKRAPKATVVAAAETPATT